MSVLIFDFDGTIADSMDLAIEIFYEVTGHPRIDDPERIAHLRTLPLLKVAREAKVAPHQIPRLLLKGRALMHQRIDEVKSFPHLHDTLQRLHNSGYQLFVMSSNSQQNVEHFLQKHELAEYFDGVYGGVGLFSKTSALRKIMRRNKLRPEHCFYIGDEVRDMNAAHKAHVHAVAVAWGYNAVSALRQQAPFAVAERPADLQRIFPPQS
jgi:phosphoglycolate phosphatase